MLYAVPGNGSGASNYRYPVQRFINSLKNDLHRQGRFWLVMTRLWRYITSHGIT